MSDNFFINGDYKVSVNGNDVTSRFRPLLESVSVDKKAGQSADTCEIILADPEGVVEIPQDRAEIEVLLNGKLAFMGFVADVGCEIDKSSGRGMTISGSSMDQGGKAKQPVLRNKDDASLADVAKEWGGKADLDIQVLGSLLDVERDYWIMQNESCVSWAQRIAKETGGTFRVIGKRGFLVGRNEGISSSGQALTPISAIAGRNLISGSIQPIISRPKYSKTQAEYFDQKTGERKQVDEDTPVTGIPAGFKHRFSAHDEKEAKDFLRASSKETDREQGSGTVEIVGDAAAEPEAECFVSGWKSGIDGTYRIDSVGHKLDKSSGFGTSLGVKQPSG